MSSLIVKSPYIKCGGKRNASGYMNYIATRDGVVFPSGYVDNMENRPRSHGLFGDDEAIDLAKTKEEIDNYTGRIWTHIISLKREDASRLGYDTPEDWRELLQTHRNDIAQTSGTNKKKIQSKKRKGQDSEIGKEI